jgi:hemoglobin-like flavoprotein
MSTMKPQAIQAVREGFVKIAPLRDELGALFYTKLFEMAPHLMPLFRGDRETQGRMLMTAIQMVVDGLDNPEQVARQVAEIGHRHIGYGAERADFDVFGAALLWTFRQGLGPDYTDAFEAGWVEAFDFIRNIMRGHDKVTVAGH